MKRYIFLITILLNAFSINFLLAQGESVFDSEVIHEVKITTLSPNAWGDVIKNYETKDYIPVEVVIDGTKLNSVGLRIKGNRINHLPGRPKFESLKLDFNEFQKKQKYDGLKKLNLKNRNIVANHLLYKLALDYQIPSCRTSFAKVYIDDEYIGSYLLIEQIDKTYLEQTFGNKKGNLYKASGKGGLLKYIGTDPSQYHYPYEKKTNEKENDYSDLINLLDFFTNSKSLDFEKNVEKYFNIDQFVKALAIEMLVNKRDAFYDAGRNYYLYNNPKSKQFEYIVDDFDYTMSKNEYTDLNFQNVKSDIQPYIGSPIITQIMKANSIKQKYYQAVCDILNIGFQNLEKELDRIDKLAQENRFNLYDLMDVKNSTKSIKEYIVQRKIEINTQFKENKFICTSKADEEDSVPSSAQNEKLTVFPTLFRDKIEIRGGKEKEELEYSLFDSIGVLIQKGKLMTSNTIDLQYLSTGIYFFQVSTSEGVETFKLIKGGK